MILFATTGLPGNKFYAGMSYGFAEALSGLISGPILKYYKDKDAVSFFTAFAAMAMMGFYYISGGESKTPLSFVFNFCVVLGAAFNYNVLYLMIEFRAPPEQLGMWMTLILTMAELLSTFAPHVAYMP